MSAKQAKSIDYYYLLLRPICLKVGLNAVDESDDEAQDTNEVIDSDDKAHDAMSKSSDDWYCSACLASIFPYFLIILTMILISSLHCTISILKVILIRNCLNRRNLTFFDDPETSHLLMSSNLDPDANFFADNSQLLSNCLYLTSSEFDKIPPLCSDTFSSLHINIRSLPKHFDDLSEFLLTLNRSFSIIAVSETWLHRSNSDLFHLPGYHFISSHREHKAGGGVGILYSVSLKIQA